jgi:DNA anti-recombination protein RmuC
MGDPITARDLENYQKAIENSGEKVASALREIAHHFGAIGQQLTQSAKADEDIKTAITGEAGRMCQTFEKQAVNAAEKFDKITEELKGLLLDLSSKLGNLKELHYDSRLRNTVWISVAANAVALLTILAKSFWIK